MNSAKQNLINFIAQHSATSNTKTSDKNIRQRLTDFIKEHNPKPQPKVTISFPKIDLMTNMWANMWRIKDQREHLQYAYG